MPKKKRAFVQFGQGERKTIERGLQQNLSARAIARMLQCAPSSVAAEVKRNRTFGRGPNKREEVGDFSFPDTACMRFFSWPWTCVGCKNMAVCQKKIRVYYSSVLAEGLAKKRRSESRQGPHMSPELFERIMSVVNDDLSRGLSPYQISIIEAEKFSVSESSVYRWVEKRYPHTSPARLRKKLKYKKRAVKKDTSNKEPHFPPAGKEHAYAAFLLLSEQEKQAVCQMDTACGKKGDAQCILSLKLLTSGVQIYLLLAHKSTACVKETFDKLERALGRELFASLFKNILTDNGCEFSDVIGLERSVFSATERRTHIYFCDPGRSDQKGACEKNHVELRKIVPKGQFGPSFDDLDPWDISVINSQVNSAPRASLGGKSPFEVFKFLHPEAFGALQEILGIELLDKDKLCLTPKALKRN